jgi:FKBP-type peptidyl-prolyl cis-trans isomerase 2
LYQTSGYLEGHRFEPYTYIVAATSGDAAFCSGLEEASLYMQPGTRSHLVINSELAFGQNGSQIYGVGAFETVLMEVEVYKVYPFDTGDDEEEE